MQLKDISGIGEKTESLLRKHEITSSDQLIRYFPRTYRTFHSVTVREAQVGDWVSMVGTITRPVSKHGARVSSQLSTLHDNSGSLTLRWFNMPYLTRSLDPDATYLVRGQLTFFGATRQLVSPTLVKVSNDYLNQDELYPIYPSLGSLKSGIFRKIIRSALAVTGVVHDPLPVATRDRYQLIDLDTAIHTVHAPSSEDSLATAIKRLSFDELYSLQLESLKNTELHKVKTAPLHWDTGTLENWVTQLPYALTGAQSRVIQEILSDLQKPIAMHRLLAGEVGSGKTVVAAAAALACFESGKQTLVMAPTQILAEQLYQALSQLLPKSLTYALVTAGSTGDTKADLVVGTQALLSGKLKFGAVGLIIVDEQHKFGVKQRESLSSLPSFPHTLMMTATPIPRTMAMTIFSNLDISRLDELPSSRLPIKSYLVPNEKRDKAYAWIKNEILVNDNQAFVVVPLIEEVESDEGGMTVKKSLKLLETDLKARFPNLVIDIMHGKMKEAEKTAHLRSFRDGITQILVATSMVEVGIDIPNANIMVIEDADRFGLAQLHQLRGRVGRGKKQGHCLLFVGDDSSRTARERLNYFVHEMSGEKLAIFDLENRGPGELFGLSQHGFFSLRFASIYDTELLQITHEAARMHSI